jgi:hypothetical protein
MCSAASRRLHHRKLRAAANRQNELPRTVFFLPNEVPTQIADVIFEAASSRVV